MVEKSSVVPRDRSHLQHLDGIRGLTAFYVVLHHTCRNYWNPSHKNEFPFWLRRLIDFTSFGQAAVAIFIVLSGYCLMMPLIQSNNTFLRGGVVEYFKRRARRILPVYYAALGVCLLLIASIPVMNRISNSGWDGALPAFKWDIIVSHILLFQNLSVGWKNKIDPPMWSVATEWQIYFVFALILLPVWRRFGMMVTVFVALALGVIPHWLFHGRVDVATFEYIGLFSFGMAGAELSFSTSIGKIPFRNHNLWGVCSLGLILIAHFAKFRVHSEWIFLVMSNVVIGLATMCLLNYCAIALLYSDLKTLPIVVRFLQAKPCVVLGSFSYSLYLIHGPVLALVYFSMRPLHFSERAMAETFLFTAVPISVVSAYLFYLAFEKPFLAKRTQKAIA